MPSTIYMSANKGTLYFQKVASYILNLSYLWKCFIDLCVENSKVGGDDFFFLCKENILVEGKGSNEYSFLPSFLPLFLISSLGLCLSIWIFKK